MSDCRRPQAVGDGDDEGESDVEGEDEGDVEGLAEGDFEGWGDLEDEDDLDALGDGGGWTCDDA
jgi:hypothetical protein